MDINVSSKAATPIFRNYEDLILRIKNNTDSMLHMARAGFTDQILIDRKLLDDIADTLDYVILSADSALLGSCSIRSNLAALTKLLKKETSYNQYSIR
tara:strand:+ start:150 stop:443 length:294 start_codon:yes stop_codon:yes gene_type:complete